MNHNLLADSLLRLIPPRAQIGARRRKSPPEISEGVCPLALFYYYFLAVRDSPIWQNTLSGTGTAGKLSKIKIVPSLRLSPMLLAIGNGFPAFT